MNRSVIKYNQELEEGVLSSIGGHLKRNWGKYALGGAAALTGGAALASQGVLGSTALGAVNAGRGLVNAGLQKVATIGPTGAKIVKGVTDTTAAVKGVAKPLLQGGIDAAKSGAKTVGNVTKSLKDRIINSSPNT